ncbi:hypothetical protein BJ165DRAFT_1502669 [Panaeolus papilionaceus]|nr:hypothetical protein BJ165DRAFT_1502669 [Panaeolus papilionaceus]
MTRCTSYFHPTYPASSPCYPLSSIVLHDIDPAFLFSILLFPPCLPEASYPALSSTYPAPVCRHPCACARWGKV